MASLHTSSAEYESLLRSLLLGVETIPPTPDNFELHVSSEVLLADFNIKWEATEKVAIDFAVGTDIPVMTALRDLTLRHVGRSLNTSTTKMITVEAALFLTAMIDFVSCACQEGYLLPLYENVSKKPKRPVPDHEKFHDKYKVSHLRKLSLGVLNILSSCKTYLNLNQLESMQKLIEASVLRLPFHLKINLKEVQYSLSQIISYKKMELKNAEKNPFYEFEDDDSSSPICNFTPYHNGLKASSSSSNSALKRDSLLDASSSSSLESNKIRERYISNSSSTSSCAPIKNEKSGQTKKNATHTLHSSFKRYKITGDSSSCSNEWIPLQLSNSDQSDSSDSSSDLCSKRKCHSTVSPDTLDSLSTSSDEDVPAQKMQSNPSIPFHNPNKGMTSPISRGILTPKENTLSPHTSQAVYSKSSCNSQDYGVLNSIESPKKSIRSPLLRDHDYGISVSSKQNSVIREWKDWQKIERNYSTPARSGEAQANKKLSWSDSRLEYHSKNADPMNPKSLSKSLKHGATSESTPDNNRKAPHSLPVKSSFKAYPYSSFCSKLIPTEVPPSKMNPPTEPSQKKPPKDAFQYMFEMQRQRQSLKQKKFIETEKS